MNAITVLMYVALLVNAFVGIVLLFYGVKKYATSLMALYALPLIGLMLVFSPVIPVGWAMPLWISIGVTSLLVLILSKPVTYLVMPLVLVAAVLALFAFAFQLEQYETIGLVGAVVVIGIWITMFVKKDLRDYMKAIIIGSMSASISVVSIIVLMWKAFGLSIPLMVYAITVPVCFVGGVLFQFLYVLPRNKKESSVAVLS